MLQQQPPDYNWSKNYKEGEAVALMEYIGKYYKDRTERINRDEEDPLKLFDKNKYRPENAKTNQQKFLIYHNIHHH